MINPDNNETCGEIFVTSEETAAEIFVQNSQTIPHQISSDFDTQTGAVKTVTEMSKITDKLPDFYQVGDKYIDLILKNPNHTRVLINVTDLHDIYTAGEGIDITNQVISAVFPDINWGNIVGELENQTDIQNALNEKQGVISDLSDIRSGAAVGLTALQSSDVDSSLSVNSTNPIQNCAVTAGLNGKADVDLTNCTDVANIKMAHNAMPSDKYIDLTMGASGTTYVAPADGWVYSGKVTGTQYYWFNLVNVTAGIYLGRIGAATGDIIYCLLPVSKGDIFRTDYSITGSVTVFRFIYANGAESEAQ